MLKNKTILISGSSRGIGAATAILAKKYGANVILHGKTESKELKKIAKKIGCPYFFCDVSDSVKIQSEVKKFKKIDILVNNAGINPSKNFMQLTNQDWEQVFNVNVMGAVNFSKSVLPEMIKRNSGVIVNISSIKGYLNVSGKPAYAASKAAVMRITSSMAEEFAVHGIRVNAVAPGFTETEMTSETISPKIKSQIDRIPLKRIAKPSEIAEVILFLSSNKSSYITGQTLLVDGGYNISN